MTRTPYLPHLPSLRSRCAWKAEGTAGVSHRHCMLTAGADGEVQLTDLGSSYGTFVGSGQRLNANSPMTLHRGDTFWLGSKEQMFRITGKGGK